MTNIPNIFASLVFGDEVMQSRLPKNVYIVLKNTIKSGEHLTLDIANVVAEAMKNWAIDKGATHFTHWFQPMTGVTAEKHDSFISPDGNGKIIMEFSGKELIKGEPDASSFPSGGLRATFEARGYTAWDPTSFAFIKDDTLCIPTIFCAYNGSALDKKTPLLKSMEVLNKQAMRVLRALGDEETTRVNTTVGPEQEYFLIDQKMFEKRPDLMFTGRTLLGARPPKGQELDDHYFGILKKRVSEYMKDLDTELWKLGILSKTKHNEVAPAQHELAPIFTTTNIATDHNQLTMEFMKSVAAKHGLTCLLHEKPFSGVNGSGKHNNWSLSTDKGENLLEPGKTPYNNTRFLLFFTAIIRAVDEHQDLLRLSVASAGNDHRLGNFEAPPAILSIFIGDELNAIYTALEQDTLYKDKLNTLIHVGPPALPHFIRDTTDRNRTSPFAFTGNKFEFRMLGSSFSISGPNIILNTIVADVLKEFADELEKCDNVPIKVHNLIVDNYKLHKRIVFNGNNYSNDWIEEAEKRNLLNLRTTVDVLPYFVLKENIDLFVRNDVFTECEVVSRCEILYENYIKTIQIEALTLIDMVKKEINYAVLNTQKELAEIIKTKIDIGLNVNTEKKLLEKIAALFTCSFAKLEDLENAVIDNKSMTNLVQQAIHCRDRVLICMLDLRGVVDELETMISSKIWPFPSYSELLFSVK
ncbi:MAG: glutamine synthetase III [Clostridia bacterium]